ncbi:hypothetical protein F5B20DRAFT_326620 [Whalleya microplaca]|nr:hypothetical protein F5B20DRAFT_326620 [Whalleya microplaca]
MNSDNNLAAISCERCRDKKIRCNRKVPECTQCMTNSVNCHYPEQNKRGLPAGYVNSLEKRLFETERALFFALAEIHAGKIGLDNYESAAARSMKCPVQAKAELVADWSQHPLSNRENARLWFFENQIPLSTHSRQDGQSTDRDMQASEIEVWSSADTSQQGQVIRNASAAMPTDSTSRAQSLGSLNTDPQMAIHDSQDTCELQQSATRPKAQGRASLLARSNQSLYF